METYKPDMACPKCGAENYNVVYKKDKDMLYFYCLKCQYETEMYPTDHKEPFPMPDDNDCIGKPYPYTLNKNGDITVVAQTKPMPKPVTIGPLYGLVYNLFGK